MQKILVISPAPTHPQNAGSRARVYQLLHNLKQLGHEVHLFLLDKEHRSNHVAQRADLDAMRRTWDGFFYHRDQPRMAFGGLIDQLGDGRLRETLRPRDATLTRGRARRVRSWLRDNGWRWRAMRSPIERNLWRIPSALNQLLRAPFLVRRGVGRTLNTCCPPLYRALKPHFPDHRGLPLEKMARAAKSRAGISQIDSWYNFDIDHRLRALQQQEQFDTVIVEYVYLSRALLNFGDDVHKIIDTHDVFTDRNRRYTQAGLVESFFSTSRAEETKGLERADAIIAIQDGEKAFLQDLTTKPVITVGHTVGLHEPAPLARLRKAVLFVGAANSANVHSVNWFVREVMPQLQQSIGTVTFYVAGQVCAFVDDHEHVAKLGEVSDADALYAHADVVINPASVGTGLKIKCIEALGRGKVLVCSPHAGAGLHEGERRPYIEADGAQEFATAIVNVFNNADIYNDIALRAHRFARRYNRAAVASLEDVLDRREDHAAAASSARIDVEQRAPAIRVSRRAPNFLLIASARTGSTTLTQLLGAHPAVSCLAEPFNPEHGIKWGKQRYCQRLEDGTLLYDLVAEIFQQYTGFKHLTEQFSPSRNETLIRFPDVRRIYLWRENHLQRAVSNYISMQSRHWRSDTNKIMVTNFQPADIGVLAKTINRQKRLAERYRSACREAGCLEIAYEALFGPHCDAGQRRAALDTVFHYLGIDSWDRLPAAVRDRMDALLNPQQRKLNSPLTYQLIPNIADIENALGSAENGYLFSSGATALAAVDVPATSGADPGAMAYGARTL